MLGQSIESESERAGDMENALEMEREREQERERRQKRPESRQEERPRGIITEGREPERSIHQSTPTTNPNTKHISLHPLSPSPGVVASFVRECVQKKKTCTCTLDTLVLHTHPPTRL
jgi:hypothetical protein